MSLGFGFGLEYSKLSGGGNTDAFTIEVKTDNTGTSNDNQFQFTGALGDYDVVAKQNDIIVQTFSDLSDEATITFANGAGTYVLEVNAKESNGFTGMRFKNSGDKLKLSKINQWGVFNDTRQSLFYGCSDLTEIGNDVNWLNSITNGYQMFRDCDRISLPSGMTLNNLTDGDRMFANASLTSLPSALTLNSLTDGSLMFYNCSLTSLPSGMTLDNLENGDNMFTNNTINTERYSLLLVDMEAQNNNTNVPFHGGSSKYNDAGEVARNSLADAAGRNWSFTDGGKE